VKKFGDIEVSTFLIVKPNQSFLCFFSFNLKKGRLKIAFEAASFL